MLLEEKGGERLSLIGEGDELNGQETSFREWALKVFKVGATIKIALIYLKRRIIWRLTFALT